MNVTIITCSKRTLKAINELSAQYIKQCIRFAKIKHINVKPVLSTPTAKQSNTENLLNQIPKQCQVLICDERGTNLTTEQLAKKFDQIQQATGHICLIIGPASGFDLTLIKQHQTIKLSDLTLQHEVAQLILCEQIYRVLSYLNNHPYHIA
ncbi:23S rRNA (pseudouridine(1915)-N(3))-methyltransferase RlmH [Candidatus Comchoanobacter bicostacola]|uniref:23S rRNA (Pseudouridine(1915)-N(3))-methyltransferase RlmH n=1 Tax=Candidatus Comchoanobacter bicostacola TaxID=2919598 RepID=A0ABY5DMK7_9GAMM|nr:23S rRNA (pseudouridine(1915)-N(3))-methyltransferase RlmH [Candidatus Comchoanobacter bicostacola]UTC24954.1 23S rRNA (pseudouridine(1915)-N(3))-methyltransferase RlmH [Candidatus Comchoanobacter bicostacola]